MTVLPGDDITAGEIGRTLKRIEDSVTDLRQEVRDRHHKLSNELGVLVGPMSALGVRMNAAEKTLEAVGPKVEALQWRAAWISGAIAGIVSLLNFLLGKHS